MTARATTEDVKYLTAGFVAAIALLLIGVVVWNLTQRPPEGMPADLHYVPLEGGGDLFTVRVFAAEDEIESGDLTCRSATSTTKTFRVKSREAFQCGDALFAIHHGSHSNALILTGFQKLKLPLVLGSGRDIEGNSMRRLVFPGPGVAVDHLKLLPAKACGTVPAGAIACAENGGATGSLIVDAPLLLERALRHGERVAVPADTLFWVGFVPLVLKTDGDPKDQKLRLDVMTRDADESWLRARGDRSWMELELPGWKLDHAIEAVPEGRLHRIRPESEEFTRDDLSIARHEREQEEEIQRLVDHELLCVDGLTRVGGGPQLVLRDLIEPGCADLDGNRRSIMPLTNESAAAVRDALRDPRIRDLIAAEGRRVWDGDAGATSDPILLFDYRRAMLPGATNAEERVPVAVMGVRPRSTLYRVQTLEANRNDAPVQVASQSASPVLEVLPTATRRRDLLLLLAAQTGVMNVCNGEPLQGAVPRRAGEPATLPLGLASIHDDAVWWVRSAATLPVGCLSFARNGASVTLSLGTASAASIRRGISMSAVTAVPQELRDGDEIAIGPLSLRYRAGDQPAAYSAANQRLYPFEADAVQLLGLGIFSGGIDTSLEQEFKRRFDRSGMPIALTIDGDVQRLLSRTLYAAYFNALRAEWAKVEENKGKPLPDADDPRFVAKYDALRAAAILLDAETGHVLAAASLPRFDPWRNPSDAASLQRMKSATIPRAAADRFVENYAFRRTAAIGSTQKIATSIALAREGKLKDSAGSGASCDNTMNIEYASGAEATISCYEKTRHNVLSSGAPRSESWELAFEDSCNIYFSLAAADLVPRIAADPRAYTTSGNASLLRFARALDPGVDFRPLDLDANQPGTGNGFYETAMLLGYRFEFRRIKDLDVENLETYNDLQYPTVARPWLWGLRRTSFVYPTMPAPEMFTNNYQRKNKGPWPAENEVRVNNGPGIKVAGVLPMRSYLQLGFGQNLTGSPLSMAVMTTPILNSRRALATPVIVDGAPPAQGPELFGTEDQRRLKAGLEGVVTRGTAATYFASLTRPDGIRIGGKTGTITIAGTEPLTAAEEVYERALEYGCGTIGAAITPQEWETIATAVVQPPPALPRWGFAVSERRCTLANPGLPRVNTPLTPEQDTVWEEIAKRADRTREAKPLTSSAFVGAIWRDGTTQFPLRNPLVLAVAVDHHPTAAKTISVEVIESLLRLIEIRGR